MQTRLVETVSRTDSPELCRESAPFNRESRNGNMPMNRDTAFKPRSPFAATTGANGHRNNLILIEAMMNSKIYQEYEKAFSEATGMSVALRPVQEAQINNGDDAVPVRLGDRLIGFLQTVQTSPRKSLGGEWGFETANDKLDQTFFETDAVSAKQQESVVKLLSIFAQHLSMLSNQVVVQQENSEPPVITRAKQYIHEHQTEDISLGQVAKAVNTSMFYFCKTFKKATGINFTDYLSRLRIEKSKNLLLNPNLRVSEIAFEVGFQSLTHFNRVFKKILGQSPTEYRSQLLGY